MSDRAVLIGLMLLAGWSATFAAGAEARFELGRPATADEIAAQDIAIGPRGDELPSGSGTARAGALIYAQKCAMCHGASGHEGPDPVLVGGAATLAGSQPVLSIGSFWPYATTVYDYIYRAMPFTQPGSLVPDEVFALTAFLLYSNGIIAQDMVVDRDNLAAVRMPNRNGFIADPRPDTAPADPAPSEGN